MAHQPTCRIVIDGKLIDAKNGATILEAARETGIEIPTLCHLPGRPPQTSCMVCVVKVAGRPRLAPACATQVANGMMIENESEEVVQARRTAIELLLSDHLGDCIAPCQSTCPAGIDIPAMLRQISLGRTRDALVIAKQSVALPAALGYICPELCEKSCRRKARDEPVAICKLKRFAAEEDLSSDSPYFPHITNATDRRVAIVGAGPAGLSAAYYLLQFGHACSLFDERDEPGGMLRYGVPEDELPRRVLEAEIDVIRRMGASFEMGRRVESLAPVLGSFDAVLLACGDVRETGLPDLGLMRTEQGIQTDRRTMMSNLRGVFVAGSSAFPSKHAVRAVADGRHAALRIDAYLAGASLDPAEREFSVHAGRFDERSVAPYITLVNNGGRVHVDRGFTIQEARREASRCLQCGCAKPKDCRLRTFAKRYEANPARYRRDRRTYERDDSHPEVVFERGKCIACGICVRIAAEQGERLGIGFAGRGFSVRASVPFSESLAEGLRSAARACAEACPTNALTLKSDLEEVPGA